MNQTVLMSSLPKETQECGIDAACICESGIGLLVETREPPPFFFVFNLRRKYLALNSENQKNNECPNWRN